MGVLSVLAMNVTRAKGRPWYVFMTSCLMLAAILVAVLISNKMDGRGNLAYVPAVAHASADEAAPADALVFGSSEAAGVLEKYFRIETLDEVPPFSELMRNRYDAVILDNGNGHFDIVTVKSEQFRGQLEGMLTEPASFVSEMTPERGVGTTIVGYLIMFVLISGSTYMNFFTDDKAGGTFRRTATSPVGIRAYLAGQLLFNGLMLFVPVMGMLIVLKEVFGMDIGFSYGHYAILVGLLSGVATAFGFFLASLIENPDDGMAVASSVIIVTSLLGGSFFVFEHEDAVMRILTDLLPQTSLMDIAANLERGWSIGQIADPVVHVVAVALALAVTGWIVCERRFRAGAY